MASNSRHETSGSKKETASKTSSIELQHHYTFFFFLSLCCLPCQVAVLHQRFISTAISQKLSKGMKIKAVLGKGKDRAQLSCLDHRGIYQNAGTLV